MINSFEGLPTVLSGEQVRTVLHIGKRKCAWMLYNGFIKCENTGKKTRKYAVKLTDLIEFIVDSKSIPKNMSHHMHSSQQQSMGIHTNPDGFYNNNHHFLCFYTFRDG